MRIKAFSSWNNSRVRAFAVSVFQTQVGPRNRKLPTGLPPSVRPALDLRTAFATADTALSCHTTCFLSCSSNFSRSLFSLSRSLLAGISVAFDITSAMSSAVTFSRKYHFQDS